MQVLLIYSDSILEESSETTKNFDTAHVQYFDNTRKITEPKNQVIEDRAQIEKWLEFANAW